MMILAEWLLSASLVFGVFAVLATFADRGEH